MPSGVWNARARRSSLTLPRPYNASFVAPFLSSTGSITRLPTLDPVRACACSTESAAIDFELDEESRQLLL